MATPPDHFCIFFPEDAHAPLVSEGQVRKVIFKIAV
ncbi:MAG TPA: YhcH/YjgK/YiaL family protein [Gallionella sp.]